MAVKKTTKKNDDTRYVVTRDGYRVSDIEYTSKEHASDEYSFWNRVITRYPDGTKLDIIEK